MTAPGIDRRTVLVSSAALGVVAATTPVTGLAQSWPATSGAPQLATTRLTVNERAATLAADARTTLLDGLRENLGLTGTKKGCDQGQCGACTILVNGRRVNAARSRPVRHHR